MEEASERKREKYAELVEECRKVGVACTMPTDLGGGKKLCREVTLQGLQSPGHHRGT